MSNTGAVGSSSNWNNASETASQAEVKEDDAAVQFKSFAELKTFLSTALQQQQPTSDETSAKVLSVRLLNNFVLPFLNDKDKKQIMGDALSLMNYVEETFYLSETNHVRLRYNVALTVLCSGNPNEGKDVLLPVLRQAFLDKKGSSSSNNNNKVKVGTSNLRNAIIMDFLRCEAAFLFLECIIHANSGQTIKVPSSEQKVEGDRDQITVTDIFEWVNSHLKSVEKSLTDANSCTTTYVAPSPSLASDSTYATSKGMVTESNLSELKFRLHLYKSRILFLQENTSDIQRQSKKEMKSAMEIFQHKIRRSNTSIQEQQQKDGSFSRYEDKLHQIALYLKANSEHLKGNAKKALKLCVEAEHQSPDSVQPTAITAVHFNNLGILHQSIGKSHIALHYFSRALGVLCQIGHQQQQYNQQSYYPSEEENKYCYFSPLTLDILYNASLCAFQAKQWMNSYECMAKCVVSSPNLYAKRPKCWLLMAEACIAHHRHHRIVNSNAGGGCNFGINEFENTLIVRESSNLKSFMESIYDNSYPCKELAADLGSSEDIQNTALRPLHRALFCLQRSLKVLNDCRTSNDYYVRHSSPASLSDERDLPYLDCLEAILTDTAYVYLELCDPCACLKTTEVLIQRPIVKPHTSKKDSADPDERARRRMARFCSLHRRIAVRSYACESLCLLGKPTDALKIIDGSSVNSNLLPTSIPSNDKLPMMRTSDNTRNDDLAELLSSYSGDRNIGNSIALAASAISCSAANNYTGDLQSSAAKELASNAVFATSTTASSGIEHHYHDDDAAHASSRAFFYCLLKRKDFSGALNFLRNGWEAKDEGLPQE